jgi:hypothetical protein
MPPDENNSSYITTAKNKEQKKVDKFVSLQKSLDMDLKNEVEDFEDVTMFDPFNKRTV